MSFNLNSLRRSLLGLLLLASGAFQCLHAQLDPRLQASKTDFLDLYQQSSTAKPKPEIVTVFDFSGSMATLMYHPMFVNLNRDDSETKNNMTFALTLGSSTGGTYTIRATSVQNTAVYQEFTVTLGSSTTSTGTSGTKSVKYATSRYLRTSLSTITRTPTGSTTAGTTYTFSTKLTLTGNARSDGTGSAVTLANIQTACGCTLNSGIIWTVSGPRTTTLSPASTSDGTVPTSSSSWTSGDQTTSWTAPAIGWPGYVTATLIGSTVGTLTSTILIKPDGTQVTESDAGSVTPTGTLYGISSGSSDVRNWVRAASHVRFTALDGTVFRTVDVPIPWKIMDANSSGNPLSSKTIRDRIVKTNTDGTTTTYGSNLDIELDSNYALGNGSSVLSVPSTNPALNTTLAFSGGVAMYPVLYVDWLFKGKYAVGSYAGQYIVFDAVTPNLAGGQGANVDWGKGFGKTIPVSDRSFKVPVFSQDGTYTGRESSQSANANVIPAFTRAQAVKRAAIQTWIQNQSNVLWAFRFLDPSSEGAPSGTNIHNNSAKYQNVAAGVPTTYTAGRDSTWTVLNNTAAQGLTSTTGNSVKGMQRIATLGLGNSTPLTYAIANTLAQFNDPNNVFSTVESGDFAASYCMNHFLILFTDGNDNNNSSTENPNYQCPYITNVGTSSAAVNALVGNRIITGNGSSSSAAAIDRNSSYWNIMTYAGIAAHLSDSGINGSSGVAGNDYMAVTQKAADTSSAPRDFLPFSIKNRKVGTGSLDFGTYGHRITTMTLGVSLGGFYNDDVGTYPISPKRNMFLAAAVGDQDIKSGAVSSFHSFDPDVDWVPNPADPGSYPDFGKRADGAIYFFDATNPELLAKDLDYVLRIVARAPNTNSASSPSIPYIGASFGQQIYLGKFIPPASGGVMWNGDLLMFATQEVNSQTVIVDRTGQPASVFDSTTAAWSAQAVLADSTTYPWYNRKLYTRIPGTAGTPDHALSEFKPTGTTYTDATTGLKNFVGTDPNTHSTALSEATKIDVIRLVSGANMNGPTDASGNPTTNRGSIMGDIINSSPAVIEYQYSDVSSRLSSSLTSAGTRFRLILTGTNQGWLHAFGEVSMVNGETDPATGHAYSGPTRGAVQELWAFMPTDFLANLDYLKTPNNLHRFMVDGAPTIYHLDLPPSTGGSGNGVVDSTERACVIFGLGKGGRSYYAIDIHDPFNPVLKWSIVPDESDYFPASRIVSGGPSLSTVKTVLKNMGFSTCTPALGRVLFSGVPKDVVFLGGGYSNTDVEHNFPVYYPVPPTGQQTPLGRSVLAVDIESGQILAAVDLSDSLTAPIASGLVPFEFFLNSGMAQRAYFLDFKGGLWCWGSKAVSNGGSSDPYQNYRMDTSDLAAWTLDGSIGSTPGIRKVAQDGSGNAALYSTLPAPFRLGSFPCAAHEAGAPSPAVVGVAMISGDRNNPLDYSYGANAPDRHRLTVVFDRQDSRAWGLDGASTSDTGILDTKLADFTNQNDPSAAEITPGASYFLAPSESSSAKFGYKIMLPTPVPQTDLLAIPKGINTPSVVAGSLFFSYFTPTSADRCTGGDGVTTSVLVCDVLYPVVSDSRSTVTCKSGIATTWAGVASNFSAYGTRGVVQGGAIALSEPPGGFQAGQSRTTLSLKTVLGKRQERFPKARVWRTVH